MILNLTPHPIVLRDAAGVDHVLQPRKGPDGKADPARVASTPGVRTTVEGCPVPVVEPTEFGDLLGLPESVEPGTLILVSLVCAQAAAHEAAQLEQDIADDQTIEGSMDFSREEIAAAVARLAVLRSLVSPGQGRDVVPWTQADADAGLCPPTLVGLTRAVTALVRAVG